MVVHARGWRLGASRVDSEVDGGPFSPGPIMSFSPTLLLFLALDFSFHFGFLPIPTVCNQPVCQYLY